MKTWPAGKDWWCLPRAVRRRIRLRRTVRSLAQKAHEASLLSRWYAAASDSDMAENWDRCADLYWEKVGRVARRIGVSS